MPGLFDLPTPLFQWVQDRIAGFVPVPLSIAIWAVIGAVICMELYRVISPQQYIGRIKREANAARQHLVNYDGEMEGAWPLIKSMLGLSVRRVGIVLPATLIAAYPILAQLVWMSNAYGYRYPSVDETVTINIASPLQARWIEASLQDPPRVQALRPDGNVVLDVPVSAPVPAIHKQVWWNLLIANPAGYLPADAPVDEIVVNLPERSLFAGGPEWLRGWEAVFLPVLFIAALVYKSVRHID